MIERMSQASAEAAGFGEDFLPSGVAQGEDQFLMLERCEEGHIILVIDDDERKRGAQESVARAEQEHSLLSELQFDRKNFGRLF